MAEEFDETEDAKEDYSLGTTNLLDRIEGQWFQYVRSCLLLEPLSVLTVCRFCEYIRKDLGTEIKEKRKVAFQNVDAGILKSFFDWLLAQKRGKNGRRKCGTKYKSSLNSYWKQYRLVYERATNEKLNGQLNRVMHRVLTSKTVLNDMAHY